MIVLVYFQGSATIDHRQTTHRICWSTKRQESALCHCARYSVAYRNTTTEHYVSIGNWCSAGHQSEVSEIR